MRRGLHFLYFLIVSICCISLIEASLRVFYGIPLTRLNFANENLISEQRVRPTKYDAELGWIPAPFFSGWIPAWRAGLTTLADGLRSNGNEKRLLTPHPVTLAVGDSFTIGDEVEDWETWPSQLEGRLHTPVLNAGVFGYGIDQSYLRLIKLIPVYHPERILFAFTPADVDRAQRSRNFSAKKPYFLLKDGELELHRDHVRPPIVDARKGAFRYVLDSSVLVNVVLHNIPIVERAFSGKDPALETLDAEKLACSLLGRLQKLSAKSLVPIYVVMIEDRPKGAPGVSFERLKSCAKNPLRVIDTTSLMPEGPHHYLKYHHFNARGNRLIADAIYTDIRAIRTSLFLPGR